MPFWTSIARRKNSPSVSDVPASGDEPRSRLTRVIVRLRRVPRAGLVILLSALFAACFIQWKSQRDTALALQLYRQEAHYQSGSRARRINLAFTQMYQDLRTIARLPAVRQVGRHGENFDENGRATVQEIYNNLASNFALSEVYIVPPDLEPDRIDEVTARLETPIMTFDEMIVGRTGDDSTDIHSGREVPDLPETEIFEYRLMKKQAQWFRAHTPDEKSIRGLEVPAITGPEVITCDNSRYKPSAPNDADRSGMVYSVPVFGKDGAFHGMVSGVILSHAFRDLLETGQQVIQNVHTGYYIAPAHATLTPDMQGHMLRGEPDPGLLYSEVLDLGVSDVTGRWKLWCGLPDSTFWNRRDVRMIRNETVAAYAVVAVLAILCLFISLRESRHQELFERSARSLLEAERVLHQQEKLASVGQLAAGVAHEINTPIQYIGDNLRALADSFESMFAMEQEYRELVEMVKAGHVDPEKIAAVEKAEQDNDIEYILEDTPKAIAQGLDGVQRVATIVRAMKDFSHVDRGQRSTVDINHSLESTLTVARNEYKYVADVETDFGEISPVECYASELNQVFLNLIVNAAHAIGDTGERGKITIRTRQVEEDVEISIADTGTGIPAEIQGKIFDPFFTTKEVGKGTGQGLAIAHQIVFGKHNGTLRFETTPGQGTTFFIRLPVRMPAEAEATDEVVAPTV